MGKFIDRTGNKYGRLLVLEFYKKEGTKTFWKCQCECGNEVIRRADSLKETSSCGCLQKEITIKNFTENREKRSKNKAVTMESRTRFYRIFDNMKSRCNNPNNSHYKNYGGRGISVEWNSYQEFKNDMYSSYLEHCELYGESNTSIDRIDNSSNYNKNNCRWTTRKVQDNNKTVTIYVEMQDGILIPLKLFSEKYNLSYTMLRKRYARSNYFGTKKIPYNEIIKDNDIV